MKLESIQVLRGLAALLVVGFHIVTIQMLGGHLPDQVGGAVPILENGYAGVDLFFVISGFIMVFVTREGRRGPAPAGVFLLSRLVRIYPVWWLFAGLATIALVLGLMATPPDSDLTDYLVKSFLLLPQAEEPVLNVGWTLTHEMYFYIIFAVMLVFAARWLPWLLLLWAAAVIAAAVLGSSEHYARNLTTLAVHPMTLEFILGAFAGLAVQSGRRKWAPLMTALGAAGFIAALVFTLPPLATNPEGDQHITLVGHQIALANSGPWNLILLEWGRVIAFGVPAALLIYGVASLEAEGRWPRLKPLEAIGNWSYALYLGHILVIAALGRVLLPETAGPEMLWLHAGVSLVASLVLAWLAYRLFERPLIRAFSNWRRETLVPKGLVVYSAPIAARIW